MTPEELIRQRKQRELLAKAAQAKATGPSDDEKIVRDATKENLKTAGRLVASFSKAVAEKTKHAAALAAEKGREAQEAMARRVEEAKARKEAEAAEQARQEAELAQALAVQAVVAQLEPEVVEPVAVQSETLAPLAEPVVEAEAAPIEPEPEATPAPIVAEQASVPEPAASEAVEAAMPEPVQTRAEVPVVLRHVVSNPAPAPVPAAKPTAAKASGKPQTPKTSPAKPTTDEPAAESSKKGWQLLAGAGVAVLVLGGALAWWASHRSSETAPTQTKPAEAVSAPVHVPVAAAPAVSVPAQVEAPKSVPAPVEEKAPATFLVVEAPKVGGQPKAQTPVEVTPKTVVVSKPLAKPLAKARPLSAPKPVAKPEAKNDWQDQANDDIDAWSNKIK